LEAKETIKKMQSGMEQETELKAFVNHVEGVHGKATEQSTPGITRSAAFTGRGRWHPQAFPGRCSAGRQLEHEGDRTKSNLAIVPNN
jgi:hypothetical protein